MSKLSVCLDAAYIFLLAEKEAITIVKQQLNTNITHWEAICDQVQLSEVDKKFILSRSFLNPFAFDDLKGDRSFLKDIPSNFLSSL